LTFLVGEVLGPAEVACSGRWVPQINFCPMKRKVFLAVDLGASSGRVVAGLFDGRELDLEEVHRFTNGPVSVNGRLYWRTFELWANILAGLREAGRRYGRAIVSVGVDAWGVDFGLLDRHGELLAAPVAYRDSRTRGALERAFAIVPREEIFAETGLQFLELNSLYQLLAAQRLGSPPLDRAGRLLFMPDLFHWMMTGEAVNELTIASTSQLYNPRTGGWSDALIEKFGLPREIFGRIVPPGTTLGALLPHIAEETGLAGVKVVLPGSHDTASAVLAVPAHRENPPAPSPSVERVGERGEAGTRFTTSPPTPLPQGEGSGGSSWCYISSGTWSLMGLEAPAPVINEQCAKWNFTNEGGVAGTTRLLKNISGLWLVQECQRIWRSQGQDYNWEGLTRLASDAPPLASVFNPDDPRLSTPTDMPSQIAALCREAGQPAPDDHGAVIRAALESLALKYREVLGHLEQLGGRPIERIHIVGGGTQNRLLCQMAADACARPVLAGPIEATAIGNCLMQAIAAGDVADVAEAREIVRKSFDTAEYEPQADDRWDAAAERLAAINPATA
jgi:rhamnulokinase